MNALDAFIGLFVVVSLLRGYRSGFAVQAGGFAGFIGGLWAGATLAPRIAGLVDNPAHKPAATLFTVTTVALVGGIVGQTLGIKLAEHLRRARLGTLDSAGGSAFSVVASLAALWLLLSPLAAAPLGGFGRQIQQSAVLRELDDVLPPVPSVISRIGRLADPLGLPHVFVGLPPLPADPIELAPDAGSGAASAAASTVRISGRGCGGELVGSGFVVAPDLVVTNAHVVAGVGRPLVQDVGGEHAARLVAFDPQVDLAVLQVSGLAGRPLEVVDGDLERGVSGAVLGFPGGTSQLQVLSGGVRARYEARGRDIYGRSVVSREVYELQAAVRGGNSGGPFVLADGRVGGVVFGRSLADDDVGYALTTDELAPVLADARAAGDRSLDSGPCAAG